MYCWYSLTYYSTGTALIKFLKLHGSFQVVIDKEFDDL